MKEQLSSCSYTHKLWTICQVKGVRDHLRLVFACWQSVNELISGSAIPASLLIDRHQERGNYPTTLTISLWAHVSP
jgi:hypothetical protein